MADLSIGELAALGSKSQAMLAHAGITSVDQLRRLGAAHAYVMVKRACADAPEGVSRPSLNLLWALESALTGQPWQGVARDHRTSLLLAVDDVERGG
jgi:DNA transformation protein